VRLVQEEIGGSAMEVAEDHFDDRCRALKVVGVEFSKVERQFVERVEVEVTVDGSVGREGS
jgi:hypothetical protein